MQPPEKYFVYYNDIPDTRQYFSAGYRKNEAYGRNISIFTFCSLAFPKKQCYDEISKNLWGVILISTHDVFVLLNYLSVVVMLACCAAVATHAECRMQKLALMVCLSLTVCCIGFLIRIEANTAEVLITGQKLVYAFVTHGMFLMLLFILDYCRFQIPKALQWLFHGVNLLITVIVLTMDHHTLFYRSYHAVDQGGYAVLEKVYGPAHTLAVGIFALYMAAAVAVAVFFSIRNYRRKRRYVWRLLIAVMLPCISYLIPKLTGINNDLQPFAFAAFAVLVLLMIYKNNLYDVENIASRYSLSSIEEGLVIFDQDYLYKGCNEQAAQLFPELKELYMDTDIRSESPILTEFLDGKKDEFQSDKKIYSISIRPISQNGRLQGRVLWVKDVTMERDYTDLLKAQKKLLESEVLTLYDISYKDQLTGLKNRRCYEEDLEKLRNKDDISGIIVISADLNGLKQTNDRIGHFAGDEMLRGASSIMNQTLGEYGNVYRTGGDEFFAILTEPVPSVEIISESLDQKMHSWKGQHVKKLSFSYGIAVAKEQAGKNIDEMLVIADRAMYSRKREYYDNVEHDRRMT